MDRIERHDLINAVGLAVVLVALAFGFLWSAQRLYSTVRNDTVSTVVPDPVVSTESTTSSTTEGDAGTTSTTLPELRPNSEITIRVVNGAGIGGVAGYQTSLLQGEGYTMETAGNVGQISGAGQVYYLPGYEAEALQVAQFLQLTETSVAAMPDPVPADPGTAQILVIAGPDTALVPES